MSDVSGRKRILYILFLNHFQYGFDSTIVWACIKLCWLIKSHNDVTHYNMSEVTVTFVATFISLFALFVFFFIFIIKNKYTQDLCVDLC